MTPVEFWAGVIATVLLMAGVAAVALWGLLWTLGQLDSDD